MLRYLPLVLGVAAVAAASCWDLMVHSDVSGEAETWAALIESGVPSEIGDWEGIDMPVSEEEALVAGAVGRVSRRYRHKETGDMVDLWLIVGHMQGVARHTPDVCYKGSDFSQEEANNRYTFEVEGQPPAEFWTAWFLRDAGAEGLQRRRVFWAWTLPLPGEPVTWRAPKEARYQYAAAKALFKMYFTTTEPEGHPPLAENPANDLAQQMIPVVADLLQSGFEEPDSEADPAEAADEQVAEAAPVSNAA